MYSLLFGNDQATALRAGDSAFMQSKFSLMQGGQSHRWAYFEISVALLPICSMPVTEPRLLSYAWMQLWDPAAYLGLAGFIESHSESSHSLSPLMPQ